MALASGIFLVLTVTGIVILNMLYLFIEPFDQWQVRQECYDNIRYRKKLKISNGDGPQQKIAYRSKTYTSKSSSTYALFSLGFPPHWTTHFD